MVVLLIDLFAENEKTLLEEYRDSAGSVGAKCLLRFIIALSIVDVAIHVLSAFRLGIIFIAEVVGSMT